MIRLPVTSVDVCHTTAPAFLSPAAAGRELDWEELRIDGSAEEAPGGGVDRSDSWSRRRAEPQPPHSPLPAKVQVKITDLTLTLIKPIILSSSSKPHPAWQTSHPSSPVSAAASPPSSLPTPTPSPSPRHSTHRISSHTSVMSSSSLPSLRSRRLPSTEAYQVGHHRGGAASCSGVNDANTHPAQAKVQQMAQATA